MDNLWFYTDNTEFSKLSPSDVLRNIDTSSVQAIKSIKNTNILETVVDYVKSFVAPTKQDQSYVKHDSYASPLYVPRESVSIYGGGSDLLIYLIIVLCVVLIYYVCTIYVPTEYTNYTWFQC
jgi:hypothetical protein